MRRILVCLCVLIVSATLVPIAARGAGDASASRRATHTSDSRYFTNYRPSATQASTRYRVSGIQTQRSTPPAGCRGRR